MGGYFAGPGATPSELMDPKYDPCDPDPPGASNLSILSCKMILV